MCLHGIHKGNCWVLLLSQIQSKTFVAKNGSFLEKEFLSKEVSGRKVELDEVIVPAPLLESSSSQKPVSVTPIPISEEVNDDDQGTSDQVISEPRRSTRTGLPYHSGADLTLVDL